MGACQSSAEAGATSLERELAQAVMTAKKQGGNGKKQSFTRLMLQFGKMKPGFHKLKSLFDSISNGAEHITFADILTHAVALGLNPKWPSVEKLCLATPGPSCKIHHNELAIIFTIVYLSEKQVAEAAIFPEIRSTLEIVEQAFTYFDSSSDGFLEREELMAALKSGTKAYGAGRGGASRQKGVGEMLFDMLDFDHSGKVSFKEFLLGIQTLVLSGEGDDEMAEFTGGSSHGGAEGGDAGGEGGGGSDE